MVGIPIGTIFKTPKFEFEMLFTYAGSLAGMAGWMDHIIHTLTCTHRIFAHFMINEYKGKSGLLNKMLFIFSVNNMRKNFIELLLNVLLKRFNVQYYIALRLRKVFEQKLIYLLPLILTSKLITN